MGGFPLLGAGAGSNPLSGLGALAGAGSGSGGSAGAMGPDYTWGYDQPSLATSSILTNPLNTVQATMDPGSGGFFGNPATPDMSGDTSGGQAPTTPGQTTAPGSQQGGTFPQIPDIGQLLKQVQPSQTPQQQGPGWFTQTPGVANTSTGLPDNVAHPGGQPAAVGNAPTTAPQTSQAPTAAPAPQRRAPAAPSRPAAPSSPAASNYPDIAGSAREAGMGPVAAAATGAPAASAATGGGQQAFNPLQAIADLLLGGPQKFMQDLQGLNQQAGPAYGPTPGGVTARAATDQYTHPPAGNRPADDMPPGSAAEAVRAGYDQAAREEGTAPEAPRQQPTGIAGLPPDYFQRHGGRVGANLETINTPYGRVTANTQVAGDFQGLTQDMQAAGVPGIHSFGSYNPRPKRYGRGYSSHAYGAAFDINDEAGPMRPETQQWINQHPQQWQDMLRRHNFVQYMPQKDPNHLEWTGPGGQRSTAGAQAAAQNFGDNTPRPPADVPMTRGDRNRNPGNIKMGPDAQKFGATGVDNQGHAVFPNWEAGAAAQRSLLQSKYNNKTIPEMWNHGRGYATGKDWPKDVMRAGGFGPNDRLNLNDPATMDRLQRAIWKAEGTHPPAGSSTPPAAPTTAPASAPTARLPIQLASSSNELSPELAQMVEQQNQGEWSGPPDRPRIGMSSTTDVDEARKRGRENWGQALQWLTKSASIPMQAVTPTNMGRDWRPPSMGAQLGYGDIDQLVDQFLQTENAGGRY